MDASSWLCCSGEPQLTQRLLAKHLLKPSTTLSLPRIILGTASLSHSLLSPLHCRSWNSKGQRTFQMTRDYKWKS